MIKLINSAWLKQATPMAVCVLIVLFANSQLVYSDVKSSDDAYQTLEWDDLLPPLDLAALQDQIIDHNQPLDSSLEPTWGSEVDILGAEIDSWNNSQYAFEDNAYQSALVSTRTVDTYNGKNIQMPGYIVPLEFDETLTITQFFLVPYFGACTHLPSPSPNQMILVNYPKGIEMEPFYSPVLVSGELSSQVTENELAVSAYTMQMDFMEAY